MSTTDAEANSPGNIHRVLEVHPDNVLTNDRTFVRNLEEIQRVATPSASGPITKYGGDGVSNKMYDYWGLSWRLVIVVVGIVIVTAAKWWPYAQVVAMAMGALGLGLGTIVWVAVGHDAMSPTLRATAWGESVETSLQENMRDIVYWLTQTTPTIDISDRKVIVQMLYDSSTRVSMGVNAPLAPNQDNIHDIGLFGVPSLYYIDPTTGLSPNGEAHLGSLTMSFSPQTSTFMYPMSDAMWQSVLTQYGLDASMLGWGFVTVKYGGMWYVFIRPYTFASPQTLSVPDVEAMSYTDTLKAAGQRTTQKVTNQIFPNIQYLLGNVMNPGPSIVGTSPGGWMSGRTGTVYFPWPLA
jgi:hypothetical protein